MENNLQKITPKQIVPTIQKLQNRLDNSSSNLISLTKDLSEHKDIISEVEKKAKDKWFSSSPSNSDLFELIKSDQVSNGKTTIAIANLFENVNENTSDLAKMVACLAQLSSMTYKDIKDSFDQISVNKTSLGNSNQQIEIGQSQLNQIISMHLDRAKKDYERDQLYNKTKDRIDLTLKSANSKTEELKKSLEKIHFLKELNEKLVIKSDKAKATNSKLRFFKILSVTSIIVSIVSILFILSMNLKLFTI
jgi:hypothetical protein